MALAGFMGPVAFFGWWGLFGGREWEETRAIQNLARLDPAGEACQALAQQDYRLYATSGPLLPYIPGVNIPYQAYHQTFGCRGLTTFVGELPTAEELDRKDRAIRFMRLYNQTVYAVVLGQHPDWLQEYERQHP